MEKNDGFATIELRFQDIFENFATAEFHFYDIYDGGDFDRLNPAEFQYPNSNITIFTTITEMSIPILFFYYDLMRIQSTHGNVDSDTEFALQFKENLSDSGNIDSNIISILRLNKNWKDAQCGNAINCRKL